MGWLGFNSAGELKNATATAGSSSVAFEIAQSCASSKCDDAASAAAVGAVHQASKY